MMVPYQYTYLFADLAGLTMWFLLFLHRKDLRKEMLIMSITIAILGLYAEYFWWTRDWWNPPNITGTRIGFEDVLDGFMTGGIAAVLYEEIFKKRMYRYKLYKVHTFGSLFAILLFFISASFLFHLVGVGSFIATPVGFFLAGLILIFQRRDLAFDAILTGICLVATLIPFYFLINYISPNYIDYFYNFKNLSGLRLLNIPVEDLSFYFFSGFALGPFYLYWKGEKLRSKSS